MSFSRMRRCVEISPDEKLAFLAGMGVALELVRSQVDFATLGEFESNGVSARDLQFGRSIVDPAVRVHLVGFFDDAWNKVYGCDSNSIR